MAARELDRIEAGVNVRRMQIEELLKPIDIDDSRFIRQDIEDQIDPEEAARHLRAAWLVPRGPIRNLVELIEGAGGIVIETENISRQVDGMSIWPPGMPPLFFVNKLIPGDRQRFTLAHELAHILMHQVPSEDMEDEADRFASEFLIPADEFVPMVTDASLQELARLKRYWKMSMGSLLMKARSTNCITARRYHYLWMQMGKAGYKTREPIELEVPKERPRMIQDVLDLHFRELNMTPQQIAERLRMLLMEFKLVYMQADRNLQII